jgi:hypothetical protein
MTSYMSQSQTASDKLDLIRRNRTEPDASLHLEGSLCRADGSPIARVASLFISSVTSSRCYHGNQFVRSRLPHYVKCDQKVTQFDTLLAFRRNVLPLSSGQKNKSNKQTRIKHFYEYNRGLLLLGSVIMNYS